MFTFAVMGILEPNYVMSAETTVALILDRKWALLLFTTHNSIPCSALKQRDRPKPVPGLQHGLVLLNTGYNNFGNRLVGRPAVDLRDQIIAAQNAGVMSDHPTFSQLQVTGSGSGIV